MALRKPHGRQAQLSDAPVIETLPIEELPAGVPADAGPSGQGGRGPGGRFAPGNAEAARGGYAKRGSSRLAARLTLEKHPPAAVAPYMRSAVSFRAAACAELARTVGGGVCSAIPSSFAGSGALMLAWSRIGFDEAAKAMEAGDVARAMELASRATRMAETSSSALARAHEYAAREAKAREERSPAAPWLAPARNDDDDSPWPAPGGEDRSE
jgi:hypothetical protein